MTNIIERTLETIGFFLIISAGIAFWFITPAKADACYGYFENGETHYICSDSSTGQTYGY